MQGIPQVREGRVQQDVLRQTMVNFKGLSSRQRAAARHHRAPQHFKLSARLAWMKHVQRRWHARVSAVQRICSSVPKSLSAFVPKRQTANRFCMMQGPAEPVTGTVHGDSGCCSPWHGVQDIFFCRKDNNFLELELRALSAVPTYNCRNVPGV